MSCLYRCQSKIVVYFVLPPKFYSSKHRNDFRVKTIIKRTQQEKTAHCFRVFPDHKITKSALLDKYASSCVWELKIKLYTIKEGGGMQLNKRQI